MLTLGKKLKPISASSFDYNDTHKVNLSLLTLFVDHSFISGIHVLNVI